MFRRRNRPKSGESLSGSSGDGRNWPWDALNATELEGRSFEYQIKAAVMQEYQKNSRPVRKDSDSVKVFVGFSLFHILDTDEKYQTIKSLISVRLRWTDQYLQWDPEEFGNTSKIWMYANSIWLPDILISN
uniref:Neur_chan_LBD domain-containing protein n=1 Tax=Macrostomum lignano TaxID=282301 RepID=A0A1I8G0L3_9PLAT